MSARSVNAQFRSLRCVGDGCTKTVRCHPAVKWVLCDGCAANIGSAWAKLEKKRKARSA